MQFLTKLTIFKSDVFYVSVFYLGWQYFKWMNETNAKLHAKNPADYENDV